MSKYFGGNGEAQESRVKAQACDHKRSKLCVPHPLERFLSEVLCTAFALPVHEMPTKLICATSPQGTTQLISSAFVAVLGKGANIFPIALLATFRALSCQCSASSTNVSGLSVAKRAKRYSVEYYKYTR